ncbi:DoxX family protein [Bradyrhizobium sp. AZCC 2230]|uniref:DoxX family protein n=1 Tax=Bradyrhizobium sp. AZCC 2230 TaxID=3117021 RepID=UPI002FF1E415
MSAESKLITTSRSKVWIGWIISGLVVLFLLFDGITKLIMIDPVVDATIRIGFPLDLIRPLGIVCLACAILYAIPRTSILGAILLTGFLGGAVASKVRLEDPLFSQVLFGVYVGILAWGGLYLRDDRLRSLIPFRRGSTP